MRQRDLLRLKKILLNQKTKLLNNSRPCNSGPSHERSSDEADLAAYELSLNVSLSLQERERLLMQKIESALGKMETGAYGLCEDCDSQVEFNRLLVRPFARLCLDCQEDQENRSRFFA